MEKIGRWSIGRLAKETGVKVVTIRYYERIGLLAPARRTEGNYRVYGPGDALRLRFIRRCRDLGFTLTQVKELLRLSSEKTRACAAVDRIAKRHLAEVDEKLADLQRLRSELRRVSDCCGSNGLISECRILEALSASPAC